MAIIKSKDAFKMNDSELAEKIKELRIELVKSKVKNQAKGKANPKELRKTIARLITVKSINKSKQEVKSKK